MPPSSLTTYPHFKFSWHLAHSSSSVSNETSIAPSPLLSSISPPTAPTAEQETTPTSIATRVVTTSRHGLASPLSPSDTIISSSTPPSIFGLNVTNNSLPGSGPTPTTTPSSIYLESITSPQPLGFDSTVISVVTAPSSTRHIASASTNTDAIAGGVVGGLALLALIAAGAFLLVRHRRKSRPPPSAEFMHLARGPSELGFSATMDGKKSPTLHRLMPGPLARRGSLEDEEQPRPISPVENRDPVLEKAQESAAMREKYGASEEGGYQ